MGVGGLCCERASKPYNNFLLRRFRKVYEIFPARLHTNRQQSSKNSTGSTFLKRIALGRSAARGNADLHVWFGLFCSAGCGERLVLYCRSRRSRITLVVHVENDSIEVRMGIAVICVHVNGLLKRSPLLRGGRRYYKSERLFS